MFRPAMIAAAALLLSGCANDTQYEARQQAIGDREFARAVEGLVPGEPVNCLNASSVSGPQVIGPDRVIYREGGRTYVSNIEGSCPGLRGDPILVVELHGSQMCRNDLFKVLQRGSSIPGATCRLGAFTPYTKP